MYLEIFLDYSGLQYINTESVNQQARIIILTRWSLLQLVWYVQYRTYSC